MIPHHFLISIDAVIVKILMSKLFNKFESGGG